MAISNTTIPTTTAGVVPVPNSSIQPSTPITMPQTQGLNSVDANAFGMLLGKQADQTQQLAAQDQANANAEANNNQSLQDLLLGKEQFSQDQANAQNLPALQKQARDLQSTSMLQTANYIQGIRNIDQKNISQGERNSAQIEAQRQNGIDALLTNAQLSFTQGNIQSAQAQVKAAVDLKYNAIEQRIANSDKVLARLDLLAGRSDAKAVQAAKDRNDQLKADIAEKKKNDIEIQKTIAEATPFAPTSVIAQAQQAFKDGKGPLEVARILGQYGGDYYQTVLLKEQIETQKAQRSKIYSEISQNASIQSKAEADSWVANIASGKAKLSDVPTKLKGLVSIGLASANITDSTTKAKIEASQSVYNLAQELLTAEGKRGAVGAGVGKFFGVDTGFAGTDRATYEAKFKQLKDTLAASNLDKLKGAMSDKDIEFLRNIGTSLSLDMPESAFDAELKKVQETMTRVPGVQSLQVNTPNKFNSALGKTSQVILGTDIINNVKDDGSIEFTIPK